MISFVLDEQLSPLLAKRFREFGHEAVHIRDAGLSSATDVEVARFAASSKAILVSKDADFIALHRLGKLPCPLLWLRLGNRSTSSLWAVLAPRFEEIVESFENGEYVYEVGGDLRIISSEKP